jgi:hypothetical protein
MATFTFTCQRMKSLDDQREEASLPLADVVRSDYNTCQRTTALEEIGMRHSWMALLACTTLSWGAAPPRPARPAYAGTWKMTVHQIVGNRAGADITFCLIKIAGDRRLTAEVSAATPGFKGLKANALKADDRSLALNLTGAGPALHITVYPPRGKKKFDVLLGVAQGRGASFPIRLERTRLKAIDPKKAVQKMAGFDSLVDALKTLDPDERAKALKDVADKHAGKPIALIAKIQLLQSRFQDGKARPVEEAAADFLKAISAYGPLLELDYNFQLGRSLAGHPKLAALAVPYAKKALKLLGDRPTPDRETAVLKVLAAGLRKAGKKADADRLAPRIAKLEAQLDRLFLATALPFKPAKYAGRKGKSTRIVACELFTSGQGMPSLALQRSCDALLQTHSAKEVVLLEYHLHGQLSGRAVGDALANADAVARAAYYDEDLHAPRLILDGKLTALRGGGAGDIKARYEDLRKRIDKALETEAEARVVLKVGRKGDTITVEATVDGLKAPGEKVRLRLALVEEVVRYPGLSGQRLHHHVVRALVGENDGYPLKTKTATKRASVSLGDVRSKLQDFLTASAKEKTPFPGDMPEMLKGKLKLIALVQDDESKKILQAAQIDVPEATKAK